MLSSVVLPPPELPRMMTNSPAAISNVTPRSAATPSTPSKYVLWRLLALIMDSGPPFYNRYIVDYLYIAEMDWECSYI